MQNTRHDSHSLRPRHGVRVQTAAARGRVNPLVRWSLLLVGTVGLLLALALASTPAKAHEMRPAIATFATGGDGTFRLDVSLNLEAALAGIGPEHENTQDSPAAPLYDRLRALSAGDLRTELALSAPAIAAAFDVAFDGVPAVLALSEAEIPPVGDTALPRISALTLTGALPAAEELTWQVAPRIGNSVLRVQAAGSDEVIQATYVPAGTEAGPFALEGALPPAWTEVFANYLHAGFVHIIPKGLDHILFVVGLFLLSTRLGALLWQVTAFTVAHTATLALGTLGIVSVPAAIVEPLIALSIAWIAVENLWTDRLSRWRPLVIFGFGLLHGLGFASVLGEFGLSPAHFVTGLVAFNLGVELGQLAVIALCFLAVGFWMRSARYRQAVVVPASLAIAAVALFWTLERTGLA